MASIRVSSRRNCGKPRCYWTRRGPRRFPRHPPGQIFAEREGSHEVPNRFLERHWVDCGLPCALPLCTQRFDHVEIIASLMSPQETEKLALFATAAAMIASEVKGACLRARCPLYPQKRILRSATGMSA